MDGFSFSSPQCAQRTLRIFSFVTVLEKNNKYIDLCDLCVSSEAGGNKD